MALLSTQPITWAASLATAAFLPRLLGDHGFGQLSIALTVGGLAGSVASLGVPAYLTRRVAGRPSDTAAATTGALVLFLIIAPAIGLGGLVLLPQFGLAAIEPTLLLVTMIGMIVTGAQNILFAALNGQARHARFAWTNAVAVMIGISAGIAMLLLGANAAGYVATLLVTTTVLTLAGWRLSGLGLAHGGFSARLWRELAVGGFPFLAWELARRIRGDVDVVLVGVLLSDQAAGWLAASYRVISIPVFIPTLITTPLLPALSRQRHDPDIFAYTLRRSVIVVLLLTTPVSALILCLAPEIPALMHWGAAFDPSVPLIAILALQQPLVGLDMVFGTALVALHAERRWLRVMILAAIVNPVANLMVIPMFEHLAGNGAMGAALVEVATESMILAGALILLPRGFIDRSTMAACGRVVVASGCLVLVGLLVRPISLPLAVAAAVVTFAGAAWVLKLIKPSDIASLRRELRQTPVMRGLA